MHTHIKRKKGFTLIELLVVVSLISLLASVILVSLTTAKNRAREAKIKSEIQTIKLVLERYNSDHGGYPNPTGSADNMYCIGATDCIFIDNLITTPFPPLDESIAKQKSNLAAAVEIFPSFTQNVSFFDGENRENKGYIYLACGGSTPFCNDNEAILIYPSQDGVSFMEVGSFKNVSCQFPQCQENYGQNCGPSQNEDCHNYSQTPNACNYDANGQGVSSGLCACGLSGNEDCSSYCGSSSQNNGCTYDPNGTGSCTCGACVGTPDCNGGQSTCGNVSGCSWGGGTGDSCSGTPNCGGDQNTCGNVSGCYLAGGTGDSCSGTPNCGGDQNTCGNVTGCYWINQVPAHCTGSPAVSCSFYEDSSSCEADTNCTWDGSYCNVNVSCNGPDYYSCVTVYGCEWVPEVTAGCTGTPGDYCSGDANSCGNKSGCSWGGGTPDYCSGTPTDTCDGDQTTCGNKSGCSWGGGTPDYCSGTPTDTCDGDQTTCGNKSGCSWQN